MIVIRYSRHKRHRCNGPVSPCPFTHTEAPLSPSSTLAFCWDMGCLRHSLVNVAFISTIVYGFHVDIEKS